MKRLLLLAAICLICLQTQAQQVLYSETFEYHYAVNFFNPWQVTGNSGFNTWNCDVDYQIGGLSFPITDNTTRVAGIAGMGIDSQVRLITPAFSLSGVANGAFFKYRSFFKRDSANGKTESAIVEITTDSGATWTTLGNAPVSAGGHYTTSMLNLSAFAGAASVHIGFRYSDAGIGGTGWMIDDLKAFAPVPHDIALLQISPSDSLAAFAVQGGSIPLSGLVQNAGAQPITAFDVAYKVANGAVITQSFTGLNLAPLATMPFTFAQSPVLPGTGRFSIKVWASTASDTSHANDSASLKAFGASFIPDKVTVVEEGTGTWNSVAPQQHITMDGLKATDYPVNLISVHHGDPMAMNDYVDYLTSFRQSYIPFFLFDRRSRVDPAKLVTVVIASVPHYYAIFDTLDVYNQFFRNKDFFGYAALTPTLQVNSSGQLTVNVAVQPAIPLQGDYRLALVLTEDKVQGSTSGYAQANLFANNSFGPMGGYESLPNPVPAANMKYNFVARSIAPSPGGQSGQLPASMLAGNTYNATLSTTIDQQAWIQGHLRANVILLNAKDSAVLNSASVPLPALALVNVQGHAINAMVYPNPASTSANLLYYQGATEDAAITVTDIAGRMVRQMDVLHTGKSGVQNKVIQTEGMAAGLYMIIIRTQNSLQSLKLTVLPE